MIADESPTFALITPEEAAKRLCVSKKTLLGFVQDGSIPKIPIGRGKKRERCAFDPADIEAFARSRKQFETPKCQSSNAKAKRSTATTSSSPVVDLRAELARRTAAKQKK
ncbi:helix-turn-helix domain-containing protein [Methylosinus sp. PW1]|uniref:helix-turn-helix transcriptional regulator n=1 Tax=Methylosinus sp. PW1 TaxID=107636 RepID=UPI0012EB6BEA